MPRGHQIYGALLIERVLPLNEEEHIHQEEGREEDRDRPNDVAKEARHLDATFVTDGHGHEVRCVTDVAHSAHKHRTHRDSHQRLGTLTHQNRGIATSQIEERKVSRSVIQEGRKKTRQPEEERVVEGTICIGDQSNHRGKRTIHTSAKHS